MSGITTSNSYNNRLQPTILSAAAPSQTVLSLSYDFHLGTADNGNVYAIQNNRDATRSTSYSYDALSRVATAESAATSGGNCWGEQFGYDPWGNLLSRSATADRTGTGCTYEGLSASVTPPDGSASKNQIVGYCYDAAGNLEGQTNCTTYVYDAESRLKRTAGVTYTYDGDGKRVSKSTGKLYWTGTGSDPLDESDAAGTIDYADFRFYSSRLGRFMQQDPLGGSPSNPESLGLYAYVVNDPINLTDPLGLRCQPGDPYYDNDCRPPAPPYNGPGNPPFDASQGSCHVARDGWCQDRLFIAQLLQGTFDGALKDIPIRPTKRQQQCIDSFLRNNYGSFTADKLVPEFSLFSIISNPKGALKGGIVSGAVKAATIGVWSAGKYYTIVGTNLMAYPGQQALGADLLETGAFWGTTAKTMAEAGSVLLTGATAFATTADWYARAACKNVQ